MKSEESHHVDNSVSKSGLAADLLGVRISKVEWQASVIPSQLAQAQVAFPLRPPREEAESVKLKLQLRLAAMRQRTTFIHRPGDAVDPALLKISADSLSGPVIKAAREDRLTLALDDLPSELQTLLRDTHKLHIRWASSRLYESVSPLFSTLPPGFHLFYSPLSSTGKDT